MPTRLAVMLGLVLAGSAAGGADGPIADPYYEYRTDVDRGEFSYDDSQDIPWMENETEVLAMPEADNLLQVAVDQIPAGLSLWVDQSRITVDPKDRVIRLWLWVRSGQGAERGTYEGFRCETGEYKVYAYANPRRTPPVSKAKRPVWRPVGPRGRGNYREELLSDYFCGIRGTRQPHEIRQYMSGEYRREFFMSN
jgi:hypothetical protein